MRYGLVIVLTGFLACAGGAEEARTTVGVLTCTLADGTTDSAGRMTCGFKPTGTSADEKYDGTLQLLSPSGSRQAGLGMGCSWPRECKTLGWIPGAALRQGKGCRRTTSVLDW